MPLYTLYCASKWAVEGFSEALWLEVRQQGIQVKIIEPGVIRTEFFGRSFDEATGPGLTATTTTSCRACSPNIQAVRGRAGAELGGGKKHLEGLDRHLAAAGAAIRTARS